MWIKKLPPPLVFEDAPEEFDAVKLASCCWNKEWSQIALPQFVQELLTVMTWVIVKDKRSSTSGNKHFDGFYPLNTGLSCGPLGKDVLARAPQR